MYDYLIVGAGLSGAVLAQQAVAAGKRVLVIDKRRHVAGNICTEEVEGIQVHRYGAHIFHTNDHAVWAYVNRFASFNRFTNSPVANYHGELYSLPFNMYTFNKMWGVVTPQEAEAKIAEQRKAAGITEPQNLEEQAISLVGTDIYEKLADCWYKSVDYVNSDFEDACRIMGEGLDLSPEDVQAECAGITFYDRAMNESFNDTSKPGNVKEIAEMAAGFWVEKGYMTSKDLDDFFPTLK